MALILIIEEDADSSALIRRLLAEQGHKAVGIRDNVAVLEWLKQNLPELIITGGGKHGEAVQKRLRLLESAGLGALSIVLTVGMGALEDIRRTFGHRVRSVIPVPPTAEDITSLFQEPAFDSVLEAK